MVRYFGAILLLGSLTYLNNYVGANSLSLNDILFNGNYDFFDLSYPFNNFTIYWPDAERFKFTMKTEAFRRDGVWYATKNFAASEHGGTHLDAPYHFKVDGKHVGEIELDKLIVPLKIIDVSSIVNDDPSFLLKKHHVGDKLNDMKKPFVLLIKFGWSKFFYDRTKYLGLQENGTLHFPGLSEEVADWITLEYKNVVGIGVDTSSVDPGSSEEFPVHQFTSRAGLYNLENVKLDEAIPENGCTAFILPMKIAEGTGGPLRLVAICPK